MKKLFRIFLSFAVLMCIGQRMMAFDGSTFAEGGKYYLYNLYQSKFLQSDGKTLSRTAGHLFTFTGSSITLNDTVYTASVISGNKYKLTNSTENALMFSSGSECYSYSFDTGFNASKSEWLLIGEEEYNAYKAKNRFTVAALNVDGMPVSISILGVYNLSLNPDGKEEDGATAIGQKLKTMGYDVVGVSEDFNFHSNIWDEAWNDGVTDADNGIWSYNATTHRGGITVTASTYTKYIGKTSPLFDTDGLCLFYKTSNVDQSTLESSESWTAWNEHYGYTDSGADGMIDKGYRYYTVKLADDTEFDLYILHMDAETNDQDNAARASQLTQLANAIKATSNGRPIIVMGDTNCRYTRDKIKSLLIDALDEDSRFTVKDPWIEFGRDGLYPVWDGTNNNSIMVSSEGYLKGEVVDKVFYINNKESNIRISALNYTQDLSFINDAGEPLADHWPATVEFEYHTYDPTIDDVTTGINGTYYFRNVETGYFLKAGGWWGTHAVAGDYGTPMELALNNGKYTLQSSFGYVYNSGGGPYMDGSSALAWTAMQIGNYYVFNCDNGALAVTDTDCKYGPNQKTVEFATLNVNDKKQQWELLTAEQLLRLAKNTASTDSPFNCTHLMKFANFDRNDGSSGWTNTITADASKMTYNLGGNNSGIDNNAQGNRVGEVYVSSYSSGSYETRWDISQSFSNLPNGKYKVTCQGFYRVNYDSSKNTETGMILYATSGSTTESKSLNCMYSLQQTAVTGSTTNGSYTYPNSMSEAAAFFNAGYYPNEVTITVSDGTLKVAVAKNSTSKSSSVWTCFDNFQILYLGNPNAQTYYTGDMNGDNKVDITDVSILINKLDSNASPTDEAGDMNSDGKYNMTDLDMITKEILTNNFSTYKK